MPIASEDLGTVLLRFSGGATGVVTVGQVCAGHKNDCWLEICGRQASLRWAQERQNELWIGARRRGNTLLAKDPSLANAEAQPYMRLPAGHQEGWADAFFNVMRDIYGVIAAPDAARPRPAGDGHLRRRLRLGPPRRGGAAQPSRRRGLDGRRRRVNRRAGGRCGKNGTGDMPASPSWISMSKLPRSSVRKVATTRSSMATRNVSCGGRPMTSTSNSARRSGRDGAGISTSTSPITAGRGGR